MNSFHVVAQIWTEEVRVIDGWMALEFQIEANDLAQASALASEILGSGGDKFEILSVAALQDSEEEE